MDRSHRHLTARSSDFWLARGAILVIAMLQIEIVNDLAVGARWLAPGLELALLIPLSLATAWTQTRARRASTDAQWASIGRHKLKAGYTANGISYKVHLDGFDQSAFLRDAAGTAANNNGAKSARDKFFYSDDDGLLVAMRKGDMKYVYAEQRAQGTLQVWAEPFTKLRLQKIYNLFQDPFERADITSNTYWDWNLNEIGAVYGAMDDVFQFVATFKEFPPRSFPPSFVPSNIMESMLDDQKTRKMLREGLDPDQVRGALDRIIERELNKRGIQ
jgi:hypothetical protein